MAFEPLVTLRRKLRRVWYKYGISMVPYAYACVGFCAAVRELRKRLRLRHR